MSLGAEKKKKASAFEKLAFYFYFYSFRQKKENNGLKGETFGNVAQGMWEVVIVLVTPLSVLRGLRLPQGWPCRSAVGGEEKVKSK